MGKPLPEPGRPDTDIAEAYRLLLAGAPGIVVTAARARGPGR